MIFKINIPTNTLADKDVSLKQFIQHFHSLVYFIFGQKSMEYTVVKKTDVADLVADVNALIEKGWKATGGISIAFGRIKNTTGDSKNWLEVLFHAQALVKE